VILSFIWILHRMFWLDTRNRLRSHYKRVDVLCNIAFIYLDVLCAYVIQGGIVISGRITKANVWSHNVNWLFAFDHYGELPPVV
jgi:hypothetical protein